jgi:hypothetical protein
LETEKEGEAAAILFGRRYAEQLDNVDAESVQSLRKHYSDSEVAEIIAYVRFITLTNLTGNTVDVFFDRFRGRLLEGAVAAVAGPFALMLNQLASFDRQVGMEPVRSHRRSDPPGSTGPEGSER